MKLRIHAGYSRKTWRVLRGLEPDRLIPRALRLDSDPRPEPLIRAELREQLESLYSRMPLEFRPVNPEDTGRYHAFVERNFGSVK